MALRVCRRHLHKKRAETLRKDGELGLERSRNGRIYNWADCLPGAWRSQTAGSNKLSPEARSMSVSSLYRPSVGGQPALLRMSTRDLFLRLRLLDDLRFHPIVQKVLFFFDTTGNLARIAVRKREAGADVLFFEAQLHWSVADDKTYVTGIR